MPNNNNEDNRQKIASDNTNKRIGKPSNHAQGM